MIDYLKHKEYNSLEAKKAKDKLPKSIYKTYSAFANSDGGLILLGVSEDEEKNLFISGVNDASKLIDELWSGLNNPEKVSHNILTDKDIIIKTEKGLNYIEIHIPRAQNQLRPIYLNNNMQNCYKRNHTGDYKCSIEKR